MSRIGRYRLPTAERNDALALLGIVLGLIGALPLVAQLKRRRPPVDPRSVDELADLLAQAVDGQWRKEAIERRLLIPDPIPIRWSLSDLAVMGEVSAAVGAPESPPALRPLPHQARITEADLQAGGGRTELHHAYAGLASGRVVVVGTPGAGKTGAAVLLLLDALAHRDLRRGSLAVAGKCSRTKANEAKMETAPGNSPAVNRRGHWCVAG